MSETQPGSAAPADKPNITTFARNNGGLVAHVHQGDRLRTVFGENVQQLSRRIASALISEFGHAPEAAAAIADEKGLQASASPDEVAKLREQLAAEKKRADSAEAVTGPQLDTAHKEIARLREDVAKLQKEKGDLEEQLADARDQLTAATTQDASPASGDGSVKPAGETPSADQGSSQTTGGASGSASTGGAGTQPSKEA